MLVLLFIDAVNHQRLEIARLETGSMEKGRSYRQANHFGRLPVVTTPFVSNIARLHDQLGARKVAAVGHSRGRSIAKCYAAVYPEPIRKLVAVEGLGQSPAAPAARTSKAIAEQWRHWIDARQAAADRNSRHYPTFEAALDRIHAANPHLRIDQGRHLA